MKFQYVAYQIRGGVVKGGIEARTAPEAWAAVERQGFKPLRVTPKRQIPSLDVLFPSLSRAGTGELVRFCRQLATILISGGNLMHALEMLEKESHSRVMRRTLASIRRTLDEGGGLSAALAEHPKVFNRLFISVVEVGEYTGRLGPSLEQLADILGKEHEAKQKAMRSLMYPLGIIGLSLITLAVLMTVALPPLLKTFNQMGADVPLITRVAMGLFAAIRDNMLKLLMTLVVATVSFVLLRRIPAMRYRLDRTQAEAPLLGPFVVAGELSRFCRTIAMLLEAGVSLATALRLGVSGCKNVALQRAFSDAEQSLVDGHDLTDALRHHTIMPSMFVELVMIGEESNSLRRTMNDAADAYQKQLEERLASLLGIMEPVSTIAVGAIVGFIAFSMFVPIYAGLNAIH